MSQLTARGIYKALCALFSSLDSTDETLVKKMLWRKKVKLEVTDGGTAGTAQGETFMWYNDTGVDVTVKESRAIAPVAVTAHGTNYATFTLSKRDTAGANAATVAEFATDTVTTDDMTAFLPKSMTLTSANVTVPSGYVLTGKVAKAGTGVAIGSATAQACIEVIIEPAL
jgi:hypothetical protein